MLRYTEMLSVDAPLLLGVQLRPLSLGHVLHLQERDSIFISPVQTPLLNSTDKQECLANLTNITKELLMALTICSMTYDDFTALMSNRLWLDDEKTFLPLVDYMERWNKVVLQLLDKGEANILQTIFLFNQYLKNGYERPEVESINNDNMPEIPITCDWITTLVETITNEKSVTVKEVLDQPMKLSFLQFYKIGEKNGCIHFMTPEEVELRDLAIKGAQKA